MIFTINKYKWSKNRKIDFFDKKDLVFANIENNETYGIDLLLEWKKLKEKILLIWKKVISDVSNIIKLPNWEEIIETTLSDFLSFEEIYLTKNMEILKTNNWEVVTKIWKLKNWLIEAEIQINFWKVLDVIAKEVIIWKLDNNLNFIKY